MSKRVAVYDRPCPFTEDNTIQLLRNYAKAQDFEVFEYAEAKGKGQPALNNLLRDAKNGKFDVVLCHSLLAVGNNLKHILSVLDKVRALDIGFISIGDGLDMDSSAATLLDALMNFQRELTRGKIRIGMELARMHNVLIGRKPLAPEKVAEIIEAHKGDKSVRNLAKLLHIPKSTCWRVISDYKKGQGERTGMSEQVS
jgi:site-specific DNA recombinase